MSNNPTPADITALWTAKQQEFVESRRRIRTIRQWLAHKVEPEVPSEFSTQANIGVKLAFPVTTSLHTISVMARKRPLLKRTPLGSGMGPSKRATRIEQWSNGCLTELEGQAGAIWKPLVAGLFNQSEVACLAYPMRAHWEHFPEFDASNPPEKYQRDAKDRAPDEAGRSFKLDGKRTQSAYADFTADWKAHRIPLVVRIVPAEQYLPDFGPGMRLDGLLIKSSYTEHQLIERGYSWIGGNTHPGPGRSETDSGGTGMARSVILMEYWSKGHVCYYAGQPRYSGSTGRMDGFSAYDSTTRNGDIAEIDFASEFGIDKLLAHVAYGMQFPDEEDPDYRGVPFLYPFLSQMAGAQNLMSAKVAHSWRWAYGGIGVEPMEGAPPELLMEDGHPRKVSIPPMTAVVLPGRAVPLVHPGTAPEVDQSVAFLLNDVRGEMPQEAAFGGAGAASGHDRSLIRAHLEDAYGMVLGDPDDYSGAIGAWRWIGSTLVECASKLAETQQHSVPVYTSTDVADGQRRAYAEMTADLCDGLYDLTAYYPNQEGENLPYLQLLAEWVLQELIPQQQFLEAKGDQSPERTIVDIQTEKFLFKTPQGQQILSEMVAEELGGQREQEAFKLQQQGQMTPDGTPTAAMGGMPQGQGQGQLTGTAPGNPAQSALGGIIAGGLQGGPQRADAMATMNGAA